MSYSVAFTIDDPKEDLLVAGDIVNDQKNNLCHMMCKQYYVGNNCSANEFCKCDEFPTKVY